MDATRLFHEFRNHYNTVCKYDKRRYMKYVHHIICNLMAADPQLRYSIPAQCLRDHFLSPVSDVWWVALKEMATDPLFQRIVAILMPPRYCAHRVRDFCPMCLPVRQS